MAGQAHWESVRQYPPAVRSDEAACSRRKTLSQNFIRDDRAIIALLGAPPRADGCTAVVVGTGDGVLTREPVDHFASITVWEKDEPMAARARRGFGDLPQVTLRTGDFLAARPPARPFHLLGDHPFGFNTIGVEAALAGKGGSVRASLRVLYSHRALDRAFERS